MGPILIYDKSALQSFSIDESVWLENYFLTNLTPLFYVETLADLSLADSSRNPEDIISELAAKTPKALPNVHHSRLVLGNLFGQTVETEHGRPIVDRGITKKTHDGKIGVHFDESAESKAMNRWHKKEYQNIERDFAKQWRHNLNILNFDTAIGIVKNILPPDQRLTTLEQIKEFIDIFLSRNSKEILMIALYFLEIPDSSQKAILNRWENENTPPFDKFAPYAAYVLSIDLLFYIAAAKGLIAKERPSNKVDLAYLYYLPFCNVFVSGDKLHARTAPLFLRKNQSFMLAKEFKEGLSEINQYFLQYKDIIANVGVLQFTHYPPIKINTSIHKLWDKHCSKWREKASCYSNVQPKDKSDSSLLKYLNDVKEKSKVIDQKILETMDEADHLIITHMVSVQKGRWRILPKDIENKE